MGFFLGSAKDQENSNQVAMHKSSPQRTQPPQRQVQNTVCRMYGCRSARIVSDTKNIRSIRYVIHGVLRNTRDQFIPDFTQRYFQHDADGAVSCTIVSSLWENAEHTDIWIRRI